MLGLSSSGDLKRMDRFLVISGDPYIWLIRIEFGIVLYVLGDRIGELLEY